MRTRANEIVDEDFENRSNNFILNYINKEIMNVMVRN